MPRVLVCVSALVVQCALAFGQGSATFEVASVKLSPPIHPGDRVYFGPARGGPGTPDPGRITWSYVTLQNLLMTAYSVENYQISGPDWLSTERYDVAVTLPAGANKDSVNVMWQNLLAERFGVVLHHESKEFPVAELVIAKNGPILKESLEDLNALPPDGPPVLKNGELAGPGLVTTIMMGGARPHAHSVAKAQPLSKLTAMLGNTLHRPVLDKTGLSGTYDFTLDFTVALPGSPARVPAPTVYGSDPEPDIVAAVQQQLGLRLVASKARLDVLVIDKAEKVPTAN